MKIKNYLSQSPIYGLYLSSSKIIDDFQNIIKKQKVHLLQGLILVALFFEERDCRPTEFTNIFQVEASTLSHSLRGLEKKGFIKRTQHPTDARGYLFSITPQGIKKSLELIKIFNQIQDHFEDRIGQKKLKDFVTTLTEIQRAYSELNTIYF